jgi:hypothetical protein
MKTFLLAAMICALAALTANAGVLLTFEGVGNSVAVGNFYNGGTGGNLGIAFGPTALGLVDSDVGGSGNFANEPSPSTVLYFTSGNGAVMNIAAGFITGFSFYYSSVSLSGTVTVWDGLDASGTLLASLPLPALGSGCGGDPTGDWNCWAPVGVGFAGSAKSVNFSGTVNQIAFDNVTIGSISPEGGVPDPATFMIAGWGIAALLLRRRFQR